MDCISHFSLVHSRTCLFSTSLPSVSLSRNSASHTKSQLRPRSVQPSSGSCRKNVIFSFGLILHQLHSSPLLSIVRNPLDKMSGTGSKTKSKDLQVVDPLPVDERSPLLHRHSNGEACEEQDTEALEEQARQERREYEAGYVPVADEPSTRRLLVTMGSLWMGTFFAALGMCARLEEVFW